MRLDWFKFYPSDFLNSPDVMMMTPAARGCYITLLGRCWLNAKNGGGIPSKTDYILAVCNCTEEEWDKVREAVLAKFEKKNGQLFNPRIQEEILETQDLSEIQRKNAQSGWESRRNAVAMPPHSSRINSAMPIDKIREDKEEKRLEENKPDFQNLRTEYKKAIGKSCSNSSKNEKWYLSLCKEYGESDVLAACALWAEEENWRDKKPDLYFFFSDISRWVEAARVDKKPEGPTVSELEVERINQEGNEQARAEAERRAAKIREDEAAAAALKAEPFAC